MDPAKMPVPLPLSYRPLVEASTVSGTACPLTAHPCPRCATPRDSYSLRGQRNPNTTMPCKANSLWISERAPATGFTAQSPDVTLHPMHRPKLQRAAGMTGTVGYTIPWPQAHSRRSIDECALSP